MQRQKPIKTNAEAQRSLTETPEQIKNLHTNRPHVNYCLRDDNTKRTFVQRPDQVES